MTYETEFDHLRLNILALKTILDEKHKKCVTFCLNSLKCSLKDQRVEFNFMVGVCLFIFLAHKTQNCQSYLVP